MQTRWNVIFIVIILSMIIGCASTFKKMETSRGLIYVGMTSQEIKQVMGPPHEVGRGNDCNYDSHFYGLETGTHTIEWAWKDGAKTIVAYIDEGVVHILGQVDK